MRTLLIRCQENLAVPQIIQISGCDKRYSGDLFFSYSVHLLLSLYINLETEMFIFGCVTLYTVNVFHRQTVLHVGPAYKIFKLKHKIS